MQEQAMQQDPQDAEMSLTNRIELWEAEIAAYL